MGSGNEFAYYVKKPSDNRPGKGAQRLFTDFRSIEPQQEKDPKFKKKLTKQNSNLIKNVKLPSGMKFCKFVILDSKAQTFKQSDN